MPEDVLTGIEITSDSEVIDLRYSMEVGKFLRRRDLYSTRRRFDAEYPLGLGARPSTMRRRFSSIRPARRRFPHVSDRVAVKLRQRSRPR